MYLHETKYRPFGGSPSWLTTSTDPRFKPEADFNGDGWVEIIDISIIGQYWYSY